MNRRRAEDELEDVEAYLGWKFEKEGFCIIPVRTLLV